MSRFATKQIAQWAQRAACAGAIMVLVGCSTTPGAQGYDRSMFLSGSQPVSAAQMESVNLLELLDPDDTLQHRDKVLSASDANADSDKALGKLYDLAFAKFPSLVSPSSEAALMQRRNLVQNRITLAADRRCGRFMQHLKIQNSDINFFMGIATVATTTIAAVVPGARDAKRLAGLGAITSGSRAEFNNEYFSNLSVSVITKAIEQHRKGFLEELQRKQQTLYVNYDIAAAVGDAIRYDASCNVLVGLETANEALQRAENPGFQAVHSALINANLSRAISSNNLEEVQNLTKMAQTIKDIQTPTYLTVPAPSAVSPSTSAAHSTAVALLSDSRIASIKLLDQTQEKFLRAIDKATAEQIDVAEGSATAWTLDSLKKEVTNKTSAARQAVEACHASRLGEAWLLDASMASAQAELDALTAETTELIKAGLLVTHAQKLQTLQERRVALARWQENPIIAQQKTMATLQAKAEKANVLPAGSTWRKVWEGTLEKAIAEATDKKTAICTTGATS